MKNLRLLPAVALLFAFTGAEAQALLKNKTTGLPVQMEELSANQFAQAVEASGGTCIIPFGIMEKHGPHLPIGTDLFVAREVALRAAAQEYAIVFPAYYFGQIFEARQQPGTIAYSPELIYKLLEETCEELSRNGIKRIAIVNTHGGNGFFIKYFAQTMLSKRRDYALFIFEPLPNPDYDTKIAGLRKVKNDGGHAGEVESSKIYAIHPEWVDKGKALTESGGNLDRLKVENAYNSIWWYGKYPNHYAGDGSDPSTELGELAIESSVDGVVKMLKSIKSDTTAFYLLNRYYDEAEQPLRTPQMNKK